MSKQVLICGAGGQVGSKLAALAADFGFNPLALDRGALDITSIDEVAKVKADYEPAAVINAAAYTGVDRAEDDVAMATQVNHVGAANLAETFGDSVPLIHCSTDYVFDGEGTAPYTESQPTAPIGVYGQTKRDGEIAVLDKPFGSVLRTAWVYSDHGHNFLKTMIRVGLARGSLSVVNDQHGTPTRADDIARVALQIATDQVKNGAGQAGLYHYTAGGQTTWHGFAAEIFDVVRSQTGQEIGLSPISTSEYPTPAKRPAYSVLNTEKIQRAFDITIAPWQAPVRETVIAVLKQEEARS